MLKVFGLFFLFAFQVYAQVFSDTFYVNPNSTGIEDGQSWNTGWKDFSKFNINVDIPSNSLLLVSPGTYTKGHSTYHWIKNLSSGIYFYKLTAGTFSEIKKMQYLK